MRHFITGTFYRIVDLNLHVSARMPGTTLMPVSGLSDQLIIPFSVNSVMKKLVFFLITIYSNAVCTSNTHFLTSILS